MQNDQDRMRRAHAVPSGLDAPVQILFWEPMEFILAISALGLGVVMHALVLGIVMSAIVLWLSRKLKRGAKRGAVPHFVWYSGLEVDPALKQWFPPAWRNDFLE
jgi:type IV conjugative transfer system protein TraL